MITAKEGCGLSCHGENKKRGIRVITAHDYKLEPIGVVHSILKHRKEAPKQGFEGAPEAWIEIYPPFLEALDGIVAGAEIIVLTWLHLADRDARKVHPRGDTSKPLLGVFATRSPDRPNPIGLHPVKVLEIDKQRGLRVHPLEALDGTPIIDIKSVISNTRNE